MDFLIEQEMKEGKYDMRSFFPQPKNGFENAPEFTGPIKVVDVGIKGRGIIATSDIDKEKLVLAFVYGPQHTTDSTLIEAIAVKLEKDPSLCSEVYKLYAGKDLGYQLGVNEFEPIVKINRLRKILQINLFNGVNSTGLWILASFLNHNCLDFNCHWVGCKNFLFVRATRNIKKGEELTISYIDPSKPYPQRLDFFIGHEFLCDCRLCQHQKQNKSAEERKCEILKTVNDLVGNGRDMVPMDTTIGIVKGYLQEFEDIDKACEKPEWNFSIRFLLQQLLLLYELFEEANVETINTQRKLAEQYYEVTSTCPANVEGEVIILEVGAARYMVRVCIKRKDWQGLGKWVGILRKDLRKHFGNSDVFKLCYARLHAVAFENGIDCRYVRGSLSC